MAARRSNRSHTNGEMPLEPEGPGNRIELGAPPEIDIANDRLGELFLARRRALGLKVEDVAEDIKIKPDYVRAIEKEEFHLLPTPQYARLFVKSYAERLGFNIGEVFALLDVNAPMLVAPKPKTVAPPSEGRLAGPLPGTQATEPGAPRRLPRGPVLFGSSLGVIAVLVAIGWLIVTWEQKQEEPPSRQASTPAVVPEPEPGFVGSEPVDVPPEDPWESLDIVLQFNRDTWVSLLADGESVENRVCRAGERLTGFAAESFRLSLGHTEGVSVWVNDTPLRPFSEWTGRLEAYTITRDSVLAWIDTSHGARTAPPGNGTEGRR